MTTGTDDPRVDDALADLRAWSDALPGYDVQAGAARHLELVGRGAVPADATAMVRGSRRAWWIVGGSALIAVGLVGAWPREPATPVAARAFAAAPRMPAVERVAVATPLAPAVVEAPRSDAVAPVVGAPTRPTTRPRTPAKPSTPMADASSDDLERELAIVRRMRRALADEPSRVLELATEADREIGRGVFAEERAALRVFALARLDDARADAAAAAFLREYGDGPFAARVARIGDDEAASDDPQ